MARKIFIILIFVLALFLRFYRLGEVPRSLNADEAAIGYNAYSILKTGKDEFGQRFPLAFRSFDDYKAPVYIYLTSVSISIFGLNDFSVRFASAFTGSLTVVLTLLLVESILKTSIFAGKNHPHLAYIKELHIIPFLSAFLLSVSPWHLQFSRSAYEANVSLFFIILGAWLFYEGLSNGKILILSGIPFVLSMWTYHTPRIFVPLLLVSLGIIYFKELIKRIRAALIAALLFLILFIPLVYLMASPEGLVRAKGISSLENPKILEQSVQWIEHDGQSLIGKAIHNRRVEYARVMVIGYLEHFNPVFLFLEKAEAKYRTPGMGLLYLWELPIIVIGMYEVAQRMQRWAKILLIWMLLAPVAAAPTLWLPSAVRTIVMMPVLQIYTAFGLYSVMQRLLSQTKIVFFTVSTIIVMIISTSTIYYFHQYYVHLPYDYAEAWQYGREEVVKEVSRLEPKYDRVVVSTSLDQPQIFFLYFLRYDPAKYLSDGGTVSGKFDADKNHFGKYIFTPVEKFFPKKNERVLYAASYQEVPLSAHLISQIANPDGSPAFTIYDI